MIQLCEHCGREYQADERSQWYEYGACNACFGEPKPCDTVVCCDASGGGGFLYLGGSYQIDRLDLRANPQTVVLMGSDRVWRWDQFVWVLRDPIIWIV